MKKIIIYFKNLWFEIRFKYHLWRLRRAINQMSFSFVNVFSLACENAAKSINEFVLAWQSAQQSVQPTGGTAPSKEDDSEK